jgi:hypothetical protein
MLIGPKIGMPLKKQSIFKGGSPMNTSEFFFLETLLPASVSKRECLLKLFLLFSILCSREHNIFLAIFYGKS